MGVELPLRVVVTILECCVTFSGVKLSIKLFVLFFLSPLGSLKFYDFLSFLFILKLSNSKPFHNTLSCASTENIEEVMKFYNLGDKTFEMDFKSIQWQNNFVDK